MSNPLAIATVTATLQQLLTNALPASGVGGALVKNVRPDDQPNLPPVGVNIFLYQVSPNPAWRNTDLPTRRADNTLLRRPQAALDLHYLLTFYGEDSTLDQQRLLGATVLYLHANPVLARADIRNVQNNVAFLHTANLADQIDLVRFIPVNYSLEELSKLWSVFLKTDYVLSVAYMASVVLIETADPVPAPAPPVFTPHVTALPFSLATIHSVESQPIELSAVPPTPITLRGSNLDPTDEATFITPGKTDPISGMIQPGTGGRLLIVNLPNGLHPGVNTVRLTQLGPTVSASAPPYVLSQSNAAAFILRPTLVSITPGTPPGEITVVVSPLVGPQQRVFLLLKQAAGTTPRAFVLAADAHAAETSTFTFNLSSVSGGPIPTGNYLARVRVDEAESRLTVDASGNITGPIVTLS
jgi:Pvc16 N-terminal domain